MTAEPAAATRHTATYPGRADQLHHVRRVVASHLAGCAAADDAVLVASELAANAILHSRSRAGHFTVRTELHPDHVRIEAEDLGGPWRRRRPDARPHGLDIVEALTGPDGWGTEIITGGGRIVWARFDLDAANE
ncbi:MAG: ATP-binding protein [Streptosporangiaceae bacterium]